MTDEKVVIATLVNEIRKGTLVIDNVPIGWQTRVQNELDKESA